MKKLLASALALVGVLSLIGCSSKTVTVSIDLPFEVDNVENIEMYHFDGNPNFIEKKVVAAEDDITVLYNMFESLLLEPQEQGAETPKGGMITSFRFNLTDGTSYEMVYRCYGVKSGSLRSSTGNFEYFANADIGTAWSSMNLDAVEADASELPK